MATSKKKQRLGKGLDAIFNDASQGADIQSMINAIEKKAPQLSQVMIALDEEEASVKEKVHEAIYGKLDGKNIVKEIYIKNKIYNVVVK